MQLPAAVSLWESFTTNSSGFSKELQEPGAQWDKELPPARRAEEASDGTNAESKAGCRVLICAAVWEPLA